MTILEKIIVHKRREVEIGKTRVSLKQLEQSDLFAAPRPSLVEALGDANKSGIIAEFKRRSPSKGWIHQKANAAEIAAGYEAAGASALSILTDTEFFGGSNVDLIEAFHAVKLPILRKDFIVDKYQILEARSIGASAILLIAAALEEKEIAKLAAFAAELKMEVLLEIHAAGEIPQGFENIAAIGVNNRNLKDFAVDLNHSLNVAEKLPRGIVKISESGLSEAATILRLQKAGFQGFLIGETFMKTNDPAAACAKLISELK